MVLMMVFSAGVIGCMGYELCYGCSDGMHVLMAVLVGYALCCAWFLGYIQAVGDYEVMDKWH